MCSSGAGVCLPLISLIFYYIFQRLTCPEFWHMIKQHYGHELGLSHEEMESLQTPIEPSMQTR